MKPVERVNVQKTGTSSALKPELISTDMQSTVISSTLKPKLIANAFGYQFSRVWGTQVKPLLE